MLIALDRKPEFGYELQNAACGRGGFMLNLSLVKTEVERNRLAGESTTSSLNHGTQVSMTLVAPWMQTNRINCGDSFFASFQTAVSLYEHGLRFIGIVQSATTNFPRQYLGSKQMRGLGDYHSVVTTVSRDGRDPFDIMALTWVDISPRFFISTVGTTQPGRNQERIRWRQIPGEAPQQQHISVSIPSVAEIYYDCAGRIDRHNRCRHDDVMT